MTSKPDDTDATSEIFSRDDRWLPSRILTADDWADGSAGDLVSGAAWRAFTERIGRAADEVQASDVPDTEIDRADGYRYLAMIVRNALGGVIEGADPDRPHFGWSTQRMKFGLDCPDALYGGAHVDAAATYRVRGRRSSVHFLGISVMADIRTLHSVDVDDLELDADGGFEFIAGGAERPGNWMPLDAGANTLQVRQFFYDWDREQPATFAIERIDGPPIRKPARDMDPASFARGLDAVAQHLDAAVQMWKGVAVAKRERDLNVFPSEEFGGAQMGAQTHQRAGIGYFKLADDEALLIEVEVPAAKYWSFDLGNFWMESLDYANHQSSLNGHQARVDADGVIRAVVTQSDPGVPKWLDPDGHHQGSMIYRWNIADRYPIPSTRVVRLDELRKQLPPDTPGVTPAERAEIVERRRQHVVRRFARPL